jgi:hypothetical protein
MTGAGRQYCDREGHVAHSSDGVQTNADSILQAKARALIDAGHLPDTLPARRWGGEGAGAPCSICGVAIGQREVDIELELTAPNAGSAATHHFHVRCLSALEQALRQLERSRRSPLTGTPAATAIRSGESQEGA